MLIQKNVKITIRNNVATLSEDLYFYRNDRNINVLFEISNFNFDFIENSTVEDDIIKIINPSYSTIRLVKPSGEQLIIPKCPIKNNLVHFYISPDLIDEINEVGKYKLQITLHSQLFSEEEDSRITIPYITFDVIEPIFEDFDFNYKDGTVTDKDTTEGISDINLTKIVDCDVHNEYYSRKEIKEGTNLYEWIKGDWIVDERLNSIHDNILNLYDRNANDIKYEYNGFNTIKEALDSLLTPTLIINNFNANISTTLEKGTIVNYCILQWSYNKDIIVSQSINDGITNLSLATSLRNYRYGNSFNTNKTFTLIANDGRGEIKKEIAIKFCNKIFWGTSVAPQKYNDVFLKTLNYELSDNKKRNVTFQANNNEYIYYCVPVAYGECTFSVNGFIGGFEKVATIMYINEYNYTENYNIYKSDNANLGTTTVVIQ